MTNMTKLKKHILIIDDDHLFCIILADMVSHAGYEVTYAFNGQEGLSLLKKYPQKFQLIILDKIMPALSGMDVLKKISLMPIIREIPVIMLTGRAKSHQDKIALQYGVVEILHKPVEEALLLKSIEQALAEIN